MTFGIKKRLVKHCFQFSDFVDRFVARPHLWLSPTRITAAGYESWDSRFSWLTNQCDRLGLAWAYVSNSQSMIIIVPNNKSLITFVPNSQSLINIFPAINQWSPLFSMTTQWKLLFFPTITIVPNDIFMSISWLRTTTSFLSALLIVIVVFCTI